jgi:sugar phosphate isomerase/epimerase
MNLRLDRRAFLRTGGTAVAGLTLTGMTGPIARADVAPRGGASHAEKLGWHLGCQAYTFRRFTFREAVKKIASLGLHYVEAYPGQKFSSEQPDVQMRPDMSPAARAEVKKLLAETGVKMANFGVCRLTKDKDAARKTFEFAKEMGVETLVSEPAADALDGIEKLCDQYEMNLALHNHPKPSIYWNYETVLAACKGRSRRIGACADTGHWMRSGIVPLEAVKALAGRIISFHLKDLNEFGQRRAHDVPWGTGKGRIRAVLAELHCQQFRGVFSIEYEHNWLESIPEIAHCVGFFDGVAAQLLKGKPA